MRQPRRRLAGAFVAGATIVALSYGCATIMQGSSQSIGISSTPTGASIAVNGMPYGSTPAVVSLSRKDHHIVRLDLDGYQPFEATLSRGVSGWVAGNIIFGGLIGLAVDAITGGMYKLTPDQIAASLGTVTAGTVPGEDLMFIAVVLDIDPAWEKIGNLERIGR
jgi:hypothetical protein